MKINNVYEHFLSIQGEGKFVGKLSYFIRFVGCNMKCKFCDSMYANKYDAPFYILNLKELNSDIMHYVITGGEPLIPQNDIHKLVEYLINKGKIVTIETNGTIFYDNFIQSENLHFSISPKLTNSIPSKKSIENYQIQSTLVDNTFRMVRKYLKHYDNKQITLKFVVNNEEDVKEVNKFMFNIYFYNCDIDFIDYMINHSCIRTPYDDLIYLMPMGMNQTQLDIEKKKEIVELCKKYGYNYSPRIQIDIWDSKKGV